MDQILTSQEAGVGAITLNRPEALNAFTPDMLAALVKTIGHFQFDEKTRVIVLQGQGKAFSAGVDLKLLQGVKPKAGRIGDIFDENAYLAAQAIRQSTLPIIAKVHGFCFTGALELALHCDFILTTIDTKFGDTHAKWGLRPTWGMSQNLARAIGVRRARELSFTARTFSGAEAAAWGIANEAASDLQSLDTLTDQCAQQIAQASQGAVSAYKKLYRLHEENMPLEESLKAEVQMEFPEITDTSARLKAFGG